MTDQKPTDQAPTDPAESDRGEEANMSAPAAELSAEEIRARELDRLEQQVAARRRRAEEAGRATDVRGKVPQAGAFVAVDERWPGMLAAQKRLEADPELAARVAAELARPDRLEVWDAQQRRIRDKDQADRVARSEEYWSNIPDDFVDARFKSLRARDRRNPKDTGQDPDGKISGFLTSKHRTLIIAGPSWVGKSHAAYAATNEAAITDQNGGPGDQELKVKAWHAINLFKWLEWPESPHKRRDEKFMRRREQIEEYVVECDLLLLDDPGREAPTPRRQELFYWILDQRAHAGGVKRTIITMNSESTAKFGDEVSDRWDEPVYGRLSSDAVAVWMDGPPMTGMAQWKPFG